MPIEVKYSPSYSTMGEIAYGYGATTEADKLRKEAQEVALKQQQLAQQQAASLRDDQLKYLDLAQRDYGQQRSLQAAMQKQQNDINNEVDRDLFVDQQRRDLSDDRLQSMLDLEDRRGGNAMDRVTARNDSQMELQDARLTGREQQRMNQLEYELGELGRGVNTGRWSGEEAARLRSQILGELQPLRGRQARSQQIQTQQQREQLMQQTTDRTIRIPNPDTGQEELFFLDQNGVPKPLFDKGSQGNAIGNLLKLRSDIVREFTDPNTGAAPSGERVEQELQRRWQQYQQMLRPQGPAAAGGGGAPARQQANGNGFAGADGRAMVWTDSGPMPALGQEERTELAQLRQFSINMLPADQLNRLANLIDRSGMPRDDRQRALDAIQAQIEARGRLTDAQRQSQARRFNELQRPGEDEWQEILRRRNQELEEQLSRIRP